MLVREQLDALIIKLGVDIKVCKKAKDLDAVKDLKSQLKAIKSIRKTASKDFLNSNYEELKNEMFYPSGEIKEEV